MQVVEADYSGWQIEMIKLGFVLENFFPRLGGMEIASYFLAKSLQSQGVDVNVYCASMIDVPRDYKYPFNVYRSLQLGPLTSFLYRYNLRKLVKQMGCQLVHGHMLRWRIPCSPYSK